MHPTMPVTRHLPARHAKLAVTMALALCLATPAARGDLTQISNSPLASTTSAQVKPNIMFIMDTSGSMDAEYMPDSISNNADSTGFKNSSCNKMYYNPNITYVAPKKADGSNFSTASFTAAYSNGYTNYPTGPTSGAINLSTNFQAWFGFFTSDPAQGAYYYTYTGTQTLTPDSSVCNTTDSNSASQTNNITAAGTGGGTWSKKRVTATSGPGNTDERTNFANWYQYYRTRLMMVKATASRAFNQITDSYRVGFITIAPSNGADTAIDSAQYVAIGDFNATKRTSWFTTLFAQSSHDSTPLREALARVGRHYAGKTDGINTGMTGDPVQYSCQQNFAILTTDGYWNTGDEIDGPVQIDGVTLVGRQDSNLAITPRPMYDGGTATETTTTKTNSYDTTVSCNTVSRRTYQIQKRTQRFRTQIDQLQSKTDQLQRKIEQKQKTTTVHTLAQSTIFITGVSGTTSSIQQLRVDPSNNNSGNRLSATVSSNVALGSRIADLVPKMVAALTGGYTASASGMCHPTNNNQSSTGATITGCQPGRGFIRLVTPTTGNQTFSIGTNSVSGITFATFSNFSGGSSASPATIDDNGSCSAGTNLVGNISTVVTCSTTNPAFSNLAATSCTDTGGAFNSSGQRISCQTVTGSFANASSCPDTSGAFNASGQRISCQTITTQVATFSTMCTPGSTFNSSNGQTTICTQFSDTNFANASSCTPADSSGTTGYVTCQNASDTGFQYLYGTTCTSGTSGSGLVTQCQNGTNDGKRIRYTTQTSIITKNLNTNVSTPSTSPATTAYYDNSCYPPGTVFTPGVSYPNDGTPGPTEQPLASATDPSCTAWPCVVTSTSGGSTNSLSDVAQYYYNTDLRPSMDNNVPAGGTGTEDDKATWQHMTTFTMGLGLAGTLNYRSDYKTAGTGDFQNIRDGLANWPVPAANASSALDDLWHAAVNGRGQFFSASDPDSVVDSLTTALAGVNARVASAAAAATSNLEPVAGDNFAYTAKYKTVEWVGELEAHEIDLSTGEVKAAVTWSAQAQLDAMTKNFCDNRNIYLFRSGETYNRTTFTWNTKACDTSGIPTGTAVTGLNAAEQAYFSATQVALLSQYATMTDGTGSPATANQRADAVGDKLVNFVRGQRGYEDYETNNANKLYRLRTHVLGDIVNAQPVYVKKPFASYTDTGYSSFKTSGTAATRAPMVYVAANDGMLHGFYAGSSTTDPLGGQERWAFIPSTVLPNLYKLADNNYANNHVYSVDGTPTVGDFYDTSASAWKTVLVAGLRAGGKGYYALDITDPSTPKGLWEFKWSDTCYDATDNTTWYADCHVGYTFNNPIVTKLADGTWVVLVTSGYNNVNSPVKTGDGLGYLYVLRAYDGKILYKIATTAGTSSTPSGLNHINGMTDSGLTNNTTLRVYGVDLLGNTWRFDINDTHSPAGREAALIGTAKTSAGVAQPISTKPEVALKGSDVFIMVGTGKMIGSDDLTNTLQQSVYGFVDTLGAGPVYSNLRGSLKPLTMTQVGSGTSATRTVSCSGNAAACAVTAGWVIDLKDTGERVSVDMRLQLGTLVFGTNVPESSACTIGGYSWLNFVNYATGAEVTSSTGGAVSQKLSDSLVVGLNIVRLPDGRTVVITTTSDAKQTTVGAPFDTPSPTGKRVSWREIPQ